MTRSRLMRSHLTRSRRGVPLALGLLPILLLACESLTEVDAPDVRQPEDYATAAGASAFATGAISRFTLAFGGLDQSTVGGQVANAGLIADELFATATNAGPWDRRDPTEPPLAEGGLYTVLQTARVNLLAAVGALQRTAPDSTARLGQLFALTGFTEVFFGESYCAGVPLGGVDADFRPVYGQPLTSDQMYEQAAADFDSALAYAADSSRIAQLAAVGKGRALLNLGRFSEAAQAVASVPTSYVYQANFVPGTITGVNILSVNTGRDNSFTVPEREGTNGPNWRTAQDPRVPLVNRSPAIIGVDGLTEVWAFVPYQAADAPIPLATGIEARLIEAEVALQTGDVTTWLAHHNALRAAHPDTALSNHPLSDPGTPYGRVDLHFRERAFWLFLTGHRQGDLRRLVRQYGRDVETVFPSGVWRDGLSYGTATNMAMAAAESNNPHYAGCLNRES